MVTIRYGVNTLNRHDLVGRTPQDILDEVSEALNIPADVQCRVNGCEVGMNTTIQANSTVEFVKISGEKGAVVVARLAA